MYFELAIDEIDRLFPWRSIGQQRLEPGDLCIHVVAGVSPGEEPRQCLLEEPLPRFLLVAGVDRIEEYAVGLGGVIVAGGVADHQDVGRLVAADGRQGQMLFLAAALLAGDQGDVRV